MSKKLFVAIVVGVFLLFGMIVLFSAIKFIDIEGYERVVWTRGNGVDPNLGQPGTMQWYCRWVTTAAKYEISNDTFIIDDAEGAPPVNKYMTEKEREYNKIDASPIIIPVMMENLTEKDKASGKVTGPTPVKICILMQYNIDPTKLIELHNTCTPAYRTTLIMPVLMDYLIQHTTVLDARTIYQGEGRNKLQDAVKKSMQEDKQLAAKGIIITDFVLRKVHLEDTKFADQIAAEARAEQDRKTAEKQKIAFDEIAKAEQSKAMAEQNKRLVEAETQKQEAIKKAEGDNKQKILAAEAAKQQTVLKAEADKMQAVLAAEGQAKKITLEAEANKEQARLEGEGLRAKKLAEADGVLALGKSEAEAKRLALEAFKGEGGQRYAEVEKAKSFGAGIQKIYYIPSSMNLSTIAKDFNNAIMIGLPQPEKAAAEK